MLLSWLREHTQTAEDLAVNWQARNDNLLSERLWWLIAVLGAVIDWCVRSGVQSAAGSSNQIIWQSIGWGRVANGCVRVAMKQLDQKDAPLSHNGTLKSETPIWIVRPDNTITESH